MQIIHVNLARGFRGGERQATILIRALSKLGVKQSLVCRRGSPMVHELGDACCTVYETRFPRLSALSRSYSNTVEETLVHAHESKASQWAFLYYLTSRTPYMITRRIQKCPSTRLLTRLTYKCAKSVVSISQSVSDTMSCYLSSLSSMCSSSDVIPDACAELMVSGENSYLRKRYPGKFIIGHVGALSIEEKGQDILIDAVKKIGSCLPDLQFVLIGSGEDQARLETLAQGLDNVDFLGFRRDLGNLYHGMDCFVFPSRHEGLGSSILDALYFKLPVIASNIPGVTDIISHHANGLLVNKNDSDALAEAIELVYKKPELREDLVTKGSESLKKFMPSYIGQCYYNVYVDILYRMSREKRL